MRMHGRYCIGFFEAVDVMWSHVPRTHWASSDDNLSGSLVVAPVHGVVLILKYTFSAGSSEYTHRSPDLDNLGETADQRVLPTNCMAFNKGRNINELGKCLYGCRHYFLPSNTTTLQGLLLDTRALLTACITSVIGSPFRLRWYEIRLNFPGTSMVPSGLWQTLWSTSWLFSST